MEVLIVGDFVPYNCVEKLIEKGNFADDHLLEDHFQQFVNSHIQSMSFIFEPFQKPIV